MDRYSLENLSKTFVEHGDAAQKQQEEMIIRWKNEYSSDKVPEHMLDPFNLPYALLSLVKEIDSLKRQLQDAQLRYFLSTSASYLEPEKGSTEANT